MRATKEGSSNVIGANTVCPFAFGFNDPTFSDRILCVVPCESPPPSPLPLAPLVLADPHKRKKTHIDTINDVDDQRVEESKAKKLKLSGECAASSVSENEREKEQMVNKEMEKEQEQEIEEAMKKKQERDSHCGAVVQLHVNSLLLAAQSGFFKTMFTMGMKETTQKKVFATTSLSLLLFFE